MTTGSTPTMTLTHRAVPWSSIDPAEHDVRLVVCDMDGTLLTETGELPEGLEAVQATMRTRGITFVPASGRQHATLAQMFDPAGSFIAENGNLLVHEGEVLSVLGLEADIVRRVVELVRSTGRSNLGLVVCGVRGAYIESRDPQVLAEARRYYARLELVDDLTAVEDDFLKVAGYDFGDAEDTAAALLAPIAETHQVVVSGKHWIDVMSPGADKGVALRELQEALGVTAAQTVVFGDYLNDLEMLDEAELSFAMANAHPEVVERARYLAPSNGERGVLTVLEHLLSAP